MYRFIRHVTRLHFLTLMMFMLFSLPQMASAEAIGRVLLSSGESWRQSNPNAALESLQRNDAIYEGDTLITHEGSLTLRMNDQATFTLHPHTQLSLEAYRANPAQIRLQLDRGHIRTQSGEIAEQHRDRYRLNTPFAALGIRGTDYSISLYNNQLDVYVHSGAISLSPFSDDLGCTKNTLGPCNTPNSLDLNAASGFWLRLERGEQPVRVKGIPNFIRDAGAFQPPPSKQSPLLTDVNGEPITPSIQLTQPMLNDSSQLPESINRQPSVFITPFLSAYSTDMQPYEYDQGVFKGLFDNSVLHTSLFAPNRSTPLYNFDLILNNRQVISTWFDTNNSRIYGRDASLESLLAARFWGEGNVVWTNIVNNTSFFGAKNADWVASIRNNEASLWRLPLSAQAIYFTPTKLNTLTSASYDFSQSWSQVLNTLPSSTNTKWQVRELNADSQQGTFRLTLGHDNTIHYVNGRVGESGILMGGDDQFTVRGHWGIETALLLIEDKNSKQQWISGLQQRNAINSPLAELQHRSSQEIEWGRWSHIATLTPESAQSLYPDARLRSNRHFTLVQPGSTELPKQGQADFTLVDYEAVFINHDQFQPAEISNGLLSVDFNQREFNTRFDLRAPGFNKIVQVNSHGAYSTSGEMTSLPGQTTQLNGYLTNEGNTAGLLFEHVIDADRYISGVTVWQQ